MPCGLRGATVLTLRLLGRFLSTFECLHMLAGCGELLWAGHFLAALTLGGHSLEKNKY